MKDEVKIQDEEITRSLKESNSIDEMKDTDKTKEIYDLESIIQKGLKELIYRVPQFDIHDLSDRYSIEIENLTNDDLKRVTSNTLKKWVKASGIKYSKLKSGKFSHDRLGNKLWCEIYKENKVSESQRTVIEACINESDDYKIVKKTEHGYPHYEIYKNNKFISSEDTREEAEKEIERLKQGIDEDEWKTMKGAHILINTDGDIIAGGPKSMRKEASKDEIEAGVQSANAKSKEENKK